MPAWWQTWVADWTRAQQRRAKSPASVRTWTVYLRHLGAWLDSQEVLSPAELEREHLQRWQDELGRSLAPASVQVAVSAARSILKWSDKEGRSTTPGLWAWLDTVRVPDPLPRALDAGELAAILRHYAAPTRDVVRLRDRALFWFAVTTSARVSEILSVDRDQVQRTMIVRLKGGHEHGLVMSARARAWVLEYLRARGTDAMPALWIHFGTQGRRRLRGDDANAIWAGLTGQLGIRPFTTHALRHTGVTELADHDVQDVDVVQHVGWRSSEMMMRYRRLASSRRQTLVDRLDDLVPSTPIPPAPARGRRRLRVIGGKRPA